MVEAQAVTDESSPLLGRPGTASGAIPSTSSASVRRPAILPQVERVRSNDFDSLEVDLPEQPVLSDDAERAAYELLVLSHLYIFLARQVRVHERDIWDIWTMEQRKEVARTNIEERIRSVWDTFVRPARTTVELATCLWTPFPLKEGGIHSHRVIDMLQDIDAPEYLVCHPLVTLCVHYAWEHGPAAKPSDSAIKRFAQVLAGIVTPKILHALDVIIQLIYIAFLANYIMYPPRRVIIHAQPKIAARYALLIVYAIGGVFKFSIQFIPYFLVAISLLVKLPGSPVPGDASFGSLLAAFMLHIVVLHIPRISSPALLFAPASVLPFTTLLYHKFTRMLAPVILFYLPAFLLSLYLLSLALANDLPIIPPTNLFVYATTVPMQVREALLVLFIIIVGLAVISGSFMVLFGGSSNVMSLKISDKWDRYSRPIGIRARQAFIATVVAYSTNYPSLVPFNLVHIPITRLPATLLRMYGGREPAALHVVNALIWWCTTGVCGFALAICYLAVSSLSQLCRFVVNNTITPKA